MQENYLNCVFEENKSSDFCIVPEYGVENLKARGFIDTVRKAVSVFVVSSIMFVSSSNLLAKNIDVDMDKTSFKKWLKVNGEVYKKAELLSEFHLKKRLKQRKVRNLIAIVETITVSNLAQTRGEFLDEIGKLQIWSIQMIMSVLFDYTINATGIYDEQTRIALESIVGFGVVVPSRESDSFGHDSNYFIMVLQRFLDLTKRKLENRAFISNRPVVKYKDSVDDVYFESKFISFRRFSEIEMMMFNINNVPLVIAKEYNIRFKGPGIIDMFGVDAFPYIANGYPVEFDGTSIALIYSKDKLPCDIKRYDKSFSVSNVISFIVNDDSPYYVNGLLDDLSIDEVLNAISEGR